MPNIDRRLRTSTWLNLDTAKRREVVKITILGGGSRKRREWRVDNASCFATTATDVGAGEKMPVWLEALNKKTQKKKKIQMVRNSAATRLEV